MHNIKNKENKYEATVLYYHCYASALYDGRGSENLCHHYGRVKL